MAILVLAACASSGTSGDTSGATSSLGDSDTTEAQERAAAAPSDTGDCDAPAAPNVDWHGCDKSGANLTDANLLGANLTSAKLFGATLPFAFRTDGNLWGATCPGS